MIGVLYYHPDDIRSYFGEKIAMYFAFIGYYTMFLVPPALLGLFSLLPIPSLIESVPFMSLFAVYNLVWVTIFLESWKRKCATLAYKWGTRNTAPFQEPRAAYHGDIVLSPVTDRLEQRFSNVKKLLRFYCVSVPVILFFLFLAFLTMLLYFWMEDWAREYHLKNQTVVSEWVSFLRIPIIVYVLIIITLNAIYRRLAVVLNDWG